MYKAVEWHNLANKTDQYLRDLKRNSYKDAEFIHNRLYAIKLEYVKQRKTQRKNSLRSSCYAVEKGGDLWYNIENCKG